MSTTAYTGPAILQPFIASILLETEKKLEELLRFPVRLSMVVSNTDAVYNYVTVKEMVCYQFGVPVEKLGSKAKPTNLSTARHIYCYLCRHYLKMTYESIGDTINRDYTTVLHSVQMVKDYMACNDSYLLKNITPLITQIENALHEKI